jgi:hypothetical protein
MTTKITNLILSVMAIWILAGCGGASSPITPAQIPTSLEYSGGGDITVALSVQMGGNLEFVVKDADGAIMTDPAVTLEFYGVSTNTDISSGITKQLEAPMMDTIVTDGSCGTAVVSGAVVNYTAPATWPATINCKMRAVYQSTALTGEPIEKVSLAPTSNLTFASSKIVSNAYNPSLAADSSSNLYLCYNDASTGSIYYSKSTNLGSTWSTPQLINIGVGYSPMVCKVIVNSDGSRVVVGGRYATVNAGLLTAVEELSFSSDGGSTFGDAVRVYGAMTPSTSLTNRPPAMVMDTSGVVHIIYFMEGTLVSPYIYLVACTASSCGGNTEVSGNTGTPLARPQIAISSDNKIYVVWMDSSHNGHIVQATYDGSAYTVGTPAQFTDGNTADYANVIVNRSGTPVISWEYYVTDGSAYDVYSTTWNPSTGVVGTQAKVSDSSSSLLKLGASPFVAYDNYVHVLYNTYNADSGAATIQHTMQNGSGGYTASKSVSLTNFNLVYSKWSLVTDTVGRPYTTWNTYVDGVYDVYLGVGTVQ